MTIELEEDVNGLPPGEALTLIFTLEHGVAQVVSESLELATPSF